MAKYIVNVIMSTSVEIEVEALNEKEAQTIALEQAEVEAKPFTSDDWDYEIETVFREEDFVDEEDGWCVSPWGLTPERRKF
jgi:hypothetical protein